MPRVESGNAGRYYGVGGSKQSPAARAGGLPRAGSSEQHRFFQAPALCDRPVVSQRTARHTPAARPHSAPRRRTASRRDASGPEHHSGGPPPSRRLGRRRLAAVVFPTTHHRCERPSAARSARFRWQRSRRTPPQGGAYRSLHRFAGNISARDDGGTNR
jgi:hypothetical protein